MGGCWEMFFHHHGKDPATIHHCCLLCCPGHFQSESSFFPLKITKIFSECTEMNIPNILKCVIRSIYFCYLYGYVLIFQPKDGLFHLH